MPINESFTNESKLSNVVNPGDAVSDILVDGSFTGQVQLMVRKPAGTWHTVLTTSTPMATPIHTSDPNLEYAFQGTDIVGTAEVYMGP